METLRLSLLDVWVGYIRYSPWKLGLNFLTWGSVLSTFPVIPFLSLHLSLHVCEERHFKAHQGPVLREILDGRGRSAKGRTVALSSVGRAHGCQAPVMALRCLANTASVGP